MSCLPGMPCYGQLTKVVYPKGCDPCLYVTTDASKVIYNGSNLPCTGVQTGDCLEVALQKIDNKICSSDLVAQILQTIANDPILGSYFCNLVNACPTTTTTSTTEIPATSSTTSTSTTLTPCRLWENINPESITVTYIDCEGAIQFDQVVPAGENICAQYGGIPSPPVGLINIGLC